MPELLFRLNGVPEDEAEDVRLLLEDNDIRFYETHEGFWRLGVAAIWLPNQQQLVVARQLIDEYQHARQLHHRQALEDEIGAIRKLFLFIWQHPLHFFMSLFAIAFVLLVSLVPFLSF